MPKIYGIYYGKRVFANLYLFITAQASEEIIAERERQKQNISFDSELIFSKPFDKLNIDTGGLPSLKLSRTFHQENERYF